MLSWGVPGCRALEVNDFLHVNILFLVHRDARQWARQLAPMGWLWAQRAARGSHHHRYHLWQSFLPTGHLHRPVVRARSLPDTCTVAHPHN